LSNAIKFPEKGGIILAAGAADGCVSVTVADTGIGMDAEDVKIAFQPFGQVDNRLERRYEGTGRYVNPNQPRQNFNGNYGHNGSRPIYGAPNRGNGYYGGYNGHRHWNGGVWRGSYWPRAYYRTGYVNFWPTLPSYYSTYWYGGTWMATPWCTEPSVSRSSSGLVTSSSG
jgi:hypothetical protein